MFTKTISLVLNRATFNIGFTVIIDVVLRDDDIWTTITNQPTKPFFQVSPQKRNLVVGPSSGTAFSVISDTKNNIIVCMYGVKLLSCCDQEANVTHILSSHFDKKRMSKE